MTENEQLIANSWKKSTVDYAVYSKKENDLVREPDDNALFHSTKNILAPFGIIVCTSSSVKDGINLRYAKRMVERVVKDSAFWFGLVIDKDFHVYYVSEEKEPNTLSWSKMNFDSFHQLVEYFMNKLLDVNEFRTVLQETLRSISPASKREEIILNVIQSEIPTIPLAQYGRTVTTYLDIQFKLISDIMKKLDILPLTEFCRYTSSTSLYRILNNKKETMCGLAVMNDKSEGFYLDKCISPSSSYNIWTLPQNEIDEYNNAFITSLCHIRKTDDLTMWRLYGGDDGDGVCLEYDVDMDLLRKSNQLHLMPVQYGERNNLIIQLFRFVAKLPFIMGFQFVLSYKNLFRYFVKPEGFEIEQEYRLLLIKDNMIPISENKNKDKDKQDKNKEGLKWIFNETYKIFHPLQELDFSTATDKELRSPLILRKIILGPKNKESKVNKVQLRCWLNQLNLPNIIVEESKINFYR